MPNKVVQDIKSGLQGIKGAGDVVRGSAMEATDELLDQGAGHPQSAASQTRNRALAEKGARDARAADREMGRRHGPAAHNTTTNAAGGGGGI